MGPKQDPRTGRFTRTGSTDIGESFEEPIQTPPTTVQRIVLQVEPNTPTPAPRIPHVSMADSESGASASGGQQADLAMRLRLAELEQENLQMQLCLAELNQANLNL